MAEKVPSASEIFSALKEFIDFDVDSVVVRDQKRFRDFILDRLVKWALTHPDLEARGHLSWLLRTVAQNSGVVPSSRAAFYTKKGKGSFDRMTIPVFEISGLTYEGARQLFRSAGANNARAFVLSIPREEAQKSARAVDNFVTIGLAAALREGVTGPLFFEAALPLRKGPYENDPSGEWSALKTLAKNAVAAGVFNFRIDMSPLTEFSGATFEDQHAANADRTVDLIRVIRDVEPKEVSISIAGTLVTAPQRMPGIDDLRAFLDRVIRELKVEARNPIGLSHLLLGGVNEKFVTPPPFVPAPEDKRPVWEMEQCSELATSAYHLAGISVVGEETWSDAFYEYFPRANAAEFVWKRTETADLISGFQRSAESLFKKLGAAGSLDLIVDNVESVKVQPPMPEALKTMVIQ